MPDLVCSSEDFKALTRPLMGLTVSMAWKGYGSAIGLELGRLTPPTRPTRRRYPVGEACISIEWDWRIENGVSIVCGSSNTRPEIEQGIASLQGTALQSLSVAGRVPELEVLFSNGYCLRSMAMATGDPEWFLKVPGGHCLHARSGVLVLGAGEYATTPEEVQAFAVAEATATRWGTPLVELVLGQCRHCVAFVRLDGEGHLLDYGACMSSSSPFDGRVVKCTSGCAAYIADEET